MQPWMDLKMIISGYDINCQYQIKFLQRMDQFEKDVRNLPSFERSWNKDIKHLAAVGKFHLPAHKSSCRDTFSFRYMPGSGQTDGEAQERVWAVSNPLQARAREMGPGYRHDLLNVFHDAKNEERVPNLRECFTIVSSPALPVRF